ncbi:MAG: hypothetical protein ABII06_20255 [Pseudomonadota bacterium]
MTTPVLRKIDALKAKIDVHRPLDAHMLKQRFGSISGSAWPIQATPWKGIP